MPTGRLAWCGTLGRVSRPLGCLLPLSLPSCDGRVRMVGLQVAHPTVCKRKTSREGRSDAARTRGAGCQESQGLNVGSRLQLPFSPLPPPTPAASPWQPPALVQRVSAVRAARCVGSRVTGTEGDGRMGGPGLGRGGLHRIEREKLSKQR